ncbi:hypothetical protein OUZ56_013479 [Daphnia magna]|uniref:Uncharacterized protein n=1 Tax=Daphnia magna TaxID=35525 RepID=A0ABQ9Z626_9CRUS|nr:hypothetical protein OUZ56_013479 [Daphnia magna]
MSKISTVWGGAQWWKLESEQSGNSAQFRRSLTIVYFCLSCISENHSHAEVVYCALEDMHDNLVLCKAKCKNIAHFRFSLLCSQDNIQGPPFLSRGYAFSTRRRKICFKTPLA